VPTAAEAPVHAMLLRQADADLGLPPLWLLHDLSGSAMAWLPLTRALADGRAVMGLCLSEACTPDTLSAGGALGSLTALAAAHVQALRASQPQGPYHLAGWSAGGLLAQEVAVQLQAQGEPVAFVGLLDAPWPATPQALAGTPPGSLADAERQALLAWVAQVAMPTAPDSPEAQALVQQLQRWADPAQTPHIDQLLSELQTSPWWPPGWAPSALQAVRAPPAPPAARVCCTWCRPTPCTSPMSPCITSLRRPPRAKPRRCRPGSGIGPAPSRTSRCQPNMGRCSLRRMLRPWPS